MYCKPYYKRTPSDDNREIDLTVSCNPWSYWTTSYNRENDSPVYCNPDLTEKHPGTTPEKSAYLCVAFHCSHGAIAGQCQRLVDRPGGHSTWGGKQTDGARSHWKKHTRRRPFSSRGAFTWRRRIVERLAYYSFPVFRLIGEYIFIDLFHSIQRSIRSLSSTFPNTPAPRTETGSVTNFINQHLAVIPLLGKRALSPKCAHVLCTLCKCPHVLLR